MPRPVYYQSPGNPIQPDRLPAEPMGFEFAHSEPDYAITREAVRKGAIRPVLGFPGCFVDRGVRWLCDLNW
jgi:hypothetical protein